MSQQAQIDMTGSKPDDNGLEDGNCPFHGAGNQPTLILDHIRMAFLCFACKAMGAFTVEDQSGKRIIVMDYQRNRE